MRHFEKQLQELLRQLVLMGTVAEEMISLAVGCVARRNGSGLDEVFRKEHEVNRLQLEVDDAAVKLTALHQPVAKDVRFLFMASRIAGELERVADLAVNIAQNARHIMARRHAGSMVDLTIMARTAEKMVRDIITALIRRNVDEAESVLEEERKVDALKDLIFQSQLDSMKSNSAAVEWSLAMILISRNLERIGDHATNIAEEVIYMIQGRDVRHPADAPERLKRVPGEPASAAEHDKEV